jgi:hypothetical protein
MSSEVDIANMALLGVGAKPKIASLSEDSDNARLAIQFYGPVRDAVLRSHIWNCAIERPSSSITSLSTGPDTDYDYYFQLPTNPYCLRLLQVGTKDDQPTDWKVEGRKFLYNDSSAKVVYIKRITDTNEFDPLLVDVIVNRLQIKFAPSITNKRNFVRDLIDEYELITAPLARVIDAQEDAHREFVTEDWVQARA